MCWDLRIAKMCQADTPLGVGFWTEAVMFFFFPELLPSAVWIVLNFWQTTTQCKVLEKPIVVPHGQWQPQPSDIKEILQRCLWSSGTCGYYSVKGGETTWCETTQLGTIRQRLYLLYLLCLNIQGRCFFQFHSWLAWDDWRVSCTWPDLRDHFQGYSILYAYCAEDLRARMTQVFQSVTEKQLDIFQHDQQLGGISIAGLGGTVPLTSGPKKP